MKNTNQLQRKILFPTAVYFKDVANAKELNKYLFNSLELGMSLKYTGVGNNIFLLS